MTPTISELTGVIITEADVYKFTKLMDTIFIELLVITITKLVTELTYPEITEK